MDLARVVGDGRTEATGMPARTRAARPMTEGARFPAIGDYALIGDCGSAALISRAGSIEWLCWPRFDSASLFAAILDRSLGGCFRIGPGARAESVAVDRRYHGDTAV